MSIEFVDYKVRTISAYDRLVPILAGGFDDYFETVVKAEAEFFLNQLEGNSMILDLGCGVGAASNFFNDYRHISLAADLSKEMLMECRKRKLRNLIRLDIEILPFKDESFAAIWAHTSFLHFPKKMLKYLLEDVGKLLAPGGFFFIALREGEGEGYEGSAGSERWFSYYRKNEFEKNLPKGFVVLRSVKTSFRQRAFLNFHLKKADGILMDN